jgi:hypothetical protein
MAIFMPDVLGKKNAGMSFHTGAIHLAKIWTQAINRFIIYKGFDAMRQGSNRRHD